MFKDINEMYNVAMSINDSSSKEELKFFSTEACNLFKNNFKATHKYSQNEIDLICDVFNKSNLPKEDRFYLYAYMCSQYIDTKLIKSIHDRVAETMVTIIKNECPMPPHPDKANNNI